LLAILSAAFLFAIAYHFVSIDWCGWAIKIYITMRSLRYVSKLTPGQIARIKQVHIPQSCDGLSVMCVSV
jgi:hypothetical protein